MRLPLHSVQMKLLLILLCCGHAVASQSGRGAMHGYVAFEGVAYNDLAAGKLHAKIELRGSTEGNQNVYTVETDDHGGYDFKSLSMGEYVLRISAPGFRDYQTEIYIPSDFICNLATMLKKAKK